MKRDAISSAVETGTRPWDCGRHCPCRRSVSARTQRRHTPESRIGVDPGMLEMAVMASCHDQENPRLASFVALF